MRTRLRSKFTLLFMTCAVLLAVPAVALADQLANALDDSLDGTFEEMALTTGGNSKDTLIYVVPVSGDAGSGDCNFDAVGDKATVTVASNNTSVATAKWAANGLTSIDFTGCGKVNGKTLTVTSGSAASETDPKDSIDPAQITFTTVDAFGKGNLQTNFAQFRVRTSVPANTPPSVSVTGVQAGASYEFGTVPTAGCSVTDTEDANESATPVVDSSGLDSSGLGPVQVTCSYTDGGNLTETASATYNVVDTTKPVIAAHADVSANAANANGAVVNYTLPTATDNVYPNVAVNCLPAPGSTFPLGATTVTCTATDGSGNSSQSTFKVTVSDATPPVIVPQVVGTLNNGWYTSDVALSWSVTDPESPNSLQKTGCDSILINSDQDGTTPYTCSATSAGGLSEQSVSIKRDTTAPVITDGGPKSTPDGENGWYVSEAFNGFSASDGAIGSGLADPNKANFEVGTGTREGSGLTVGSGPVSDVAGNTAASKTSTASFDVDLTNPTIQASLSPQNPASSGWYNAATGAPTVSFNCSDKQPGSGLAANACPANHTFGNGENQSHSGTVTDQAGHSATDGVSNVDVDLNAPSAPNATTDPANPVTNSGGFFKDQVKVSYGGSTDVGPSGVKGYTTAETFNTTGTHNYSGKATDNAGNESTATTGQVKVDAGVPTVAISGCPTNPVVLNSTQSVNVTANDEANGSGLVSDPSGSVSLATSAVGPQSKTITVEDKVGHTYSATCSYSVKYGFSGFLQPINNTAHQTGTDVSTFKAGSTVPVKFQLTDATGKVVQAGSAQWITPQKGSATSQAVDETVYSDSATPGTLYRWDATAQQYIYNWSTKGQASGFYYRIGVKLDDGQTYYQNISLR